jgi:hypothetical protein
MKTSFSPAVRRLFLALAGAGLAAADAQTVDSTYLTDKIYQGSGVVDLLKDVSPETLAAYFAGNTTLLLAVDVNENASGNETSTSMGVAISAATLTLRTTAGDFAFSDVFTNTSASLTSTSGTTQDYYTLFGQSGSSNLTSSTTGFDLSRFDDLLELRNVSFTGEILSANLAISFVSTATRTGENESFFDFSGGFEDLALLNRVEAIQLEGANIGLEGAPSTITYETAPVSETVLAAPVAETSGDTATGGAVTGGGLAGTSAPAAPLPPGVLLAGAAGLFLLGARERFVRTT